MIQFSMLYLLLTVTLGKLGSGSTSLFEDIRFSCSCFCLKFETSLVIQQVMIILYNLMGSFLNSILPHCNALLCSSAIYFGILFNDVFCFCFSCIVSTVSLADFSSHFITAKLLIKSFLKFNIKTFTFYHIS